MHKGDKMFSLLPVEFSRKHTSDTQLSLYPPDTCQHYIVDTTSLWSCPIPRSQTSLRRTGHTAKMVFLGPIRWGRTCMLCRRFHLGNNYPARRRFYLYAGNQIPHAVLLSQSARSNPCNLLYLLRLLGPGICQYHNFCNRQILVRQNISL